MKEKNRAPTNSPLPKPQLAHRADLLEVGGVDVGGRVDGGLLDGAGRNESVEDGDGTSLVVGTRSTSTTEGLLTDDGTSALVVVVHHARSVAEQVAGLDKSVSVS